MNRMKELREDKDFKQKDICKILNISQQQYSKYETEYCQMTYEQLLKLADFYGVSVDYILYNTDESKPYPKSIMRVEEKSTSKKTKSGIKANIKHTKVLFKTIDK